jgi:hypothetical protein
MIMNEMKSYLNTLANTEIATTNNKVEQKASRQIKENLTNLLTDLLKGAETENQVVVMRTEKGVGIAINNEIGWVSIEINAVVKTLDYDLVEENEIYHDKVESRELKAKEQAEAKAKKIAQQKKLQEKKAELKAIKEAE